MEILTYPNPLLREETQVVHRDNILKDEFRRKCWKMLSLMAASNGIGLAATQVGWDSRVFVMVNSDGKRRIIINPDWVPLNDKKWAPFEGCLSFPDLVGNIERFHDIRLLYTDITGRIRHECFSGLDAQIVQHETEHLDGILLIDHKPNLVKRRSASNATV
jgi:peptide deformylase